MVCIRRTGIYNEKDNNSVNYSLGIGAFYSYQIMNNIAFPFYIGQLCSMTKFSKQLENKHSTLVVYKLASAYKIQSATSSTVSTIVLISPPAELVSIM